jgi:hypothetical protein
MHRTTQATTTHLQKGFLYDPGETVGHVWRVHFGSLLAVCMLFVRSKKMYDRGRLIANRVVRTKGSICFLRWILAAID